MAARIARKRPFLLGSAAFAVAVVVLVAAAGRASAALASGAAQNPIQAENSLPGTPGWDDFASIAQQDAISGFASSTSVNHGGSIDFYVTTTAASFTIDIFRVGWYQGIGARLMESLGTFPGVHQPIPAPDPVTGMVSCNNWTKTTTLNVPSSWVTGVYLAKLSASNGNKSFIVFVVRNDGGTEPILFQTSVTTYQAYNAWGGVSLYTNNTNKSVYKYAHATKVSFDRPYDPLDGNGAGHFFLYEYPFIRWAESQGYNLTYITDVDTASDVNPLTNHRVYLSVGHDEYWSHAMRDNVTNAIAAGVNAAFFSANTAYWQIRFEPNSLGVPNRVEVGYKDFATSPSAPGPDPQWNVNNSIVTVNWRDSPVNLPENSFIGVMYNGQVDQSYPYVVQNASNWIYAGTGFTNGTSIPGIVGYEYDQVFNNGFTPAGETVLSNSPVVNCCGGGSSHANSTLYTAPSGAQVFAGGTIQWSWGLDNYSGGTVSAGLQQTTANILNAFSAGPANPAPAVTLTPTSLTFPGQPTGSTSAAQTVSVTNSGTAPLTLSSITIAGANAGDFAGTSNCPTSPATLAANASCTVSVTFAPTATGTRSAALSLTDDAAGSPQSVSLTGTGTAPAPAVTLTPASLAFGNQPVGTTSGAKSATVTNSGTNPLTISKIALTGANPADFAESDTCPLAPATLATGATCTITVTFSPAATGSRTAAVTLTDDAPDSPQALALTGTGTAPAVTLAPATLAFGSQMVGTTSATQTSTLTNSGTAPLAISAISVTGTNAADFAETSTCPISPSTLAANGTCTISVTFTPGATGARSASVSIADNASGSPHVLALSGTGSTSPISFDSALGSHTQNVRATTMKLTTTAAATAGSRVFVFVNWNAGATITLKSLTGGGLTWSVDVQAKDTSNFHGAIASATAPSGLPSGTVLTATFSNSAVTGLMAAASFTGIASTSPVDATASHTQGGVAAWTGSVTTANPNDLVLGWSGIDANAKSTPTAPNLEIYDFGDVNYFAWATAAYQIVTSAGTKTVNGTWSSTTGSTANVTVVAAYKSG